MSKSIQEVRIDDVLNHKGVIDDDRREFLRWTAVGLASLGIPLGNLVISSAVADDDVIEITVYGSDDDAITLMIEKTVVRHAADAARDMAVLTGTAGAAAISTANPVGVKAGILLLIASAEWIMISFLLSVIANDPPRKNYKTENFKRDPIYDPNKVQYQKTPALNECAKSLGDLVTSTRQLFDSLELWQGARLAKDRTWVNKQAGHFHDAYRRFVPGSLALPDQCLAVLNTVKSPPRGSGLTFADITAKSKDLSGQKLGSIAAVKQILDREVHWNADVFDGIAADVRNALDNTEIKPFDEQKYKDTVRQLSAAAASFKPAPA